MMRDLIIIGSGPAGLTAAMYAARANLRPLVFEGLQPGGQLTITSEVENFPGFPEGITGPELMDRLREQAQKFGSEHLWEEVTAVDFAAGSLRVFVGDDVHEAKSVIVSTGASARWLGLASEERLRGRGVSACATCDGFFFRDQEVFVVGGGDSAAEEATFLTRFARKVTLIHRRDELRASPIMQKKTLENAKMAFLWDSVVEDIVGGNQVEGVVVRNVKNGEVSTHKGDGVFVAIGHTPNTAAFRGHLDMDSSGYLVVKDHTETNVPGVFAAGDVADSRYRQAITAAGMGCMAALDAQKFLTEQDS